MTITLSTGVTTGSSARDISIPAEKTTIPNTFLEIRSIILTRTHGTLVIRLAKAHTIRFGERILSKQAGKVYCRALQIQLPVEYPRKNGLVLDYEFNPQGPPEQIPGTLPQASPYPEIPPLQIPPETIIAHYRAGSTQNSTSPDSVFLFPDISPHHHHLQTIPENAPQTINHPTPSLRFFPGQSMLAQLHLPATDNVRILAVLRFPQGNTTGKIPFLQFSFPSHKTHLIQAQPDTKQSVIIKSWPIKVQGSTANLKIQLPTTAKDIPYIDLYELWILDQKLPNAYWRFLKKQLTERYQPQK